MNGIQYLIKCVKGLNVDKMVETAKYVSGKTGKNYAAVLADILYCGLRYRAGYNDYREFELYLVKGKKRGTYITRGINNNIIRFYNDKSCFDLFDDKTKFNKAYSDFIGREWIDLRESGYEGFCDFVSKHNKIVVKPFNGQCGVGVEVYEFKDGSELKKSFDSFLENEQYLAEEFIVQHPEMSRLCPTAVNTLRVFTFCRDGESHFLQAALKMGNTGNVDNFYNGGMYTFSDENGKITMPAIDKADHVYKVHPATGADIVGFQVPMFDEVKHLVEKAALVTPEAGYVGWDVAVTPEKPVIIEGNIYPGIFQPRASFSKNGEGILPLYRKYMKI